MATLPHDVKAERAVLGAMMLDPRVIPSVTLHLTAESFYKTRHQNIFKAILRAEEQGVVDLVTVGDELAKIDPGTADLAAIIGETPTAANAAHYVGIVKEKAARRSVIRICDTTRVAAIDRQSDIKEVINDMESGVQKLTRKVTKEVDPEIFNSTLERVDAYLDRHGLEEEGSPLFVRTGFYDLDKRIGGLFPGTHNIIAGRPAMGKTALGLSIALNVAAAGKAPLIFTLEQTKERLLDRLLSMSIPLDLLKFRRGALSEEEKRILMQRSIDVARLNIRIIDGQHSTSDIRAYVMRAQQVRPVDLVMVDFLTLIKPPPRMSKKENHEIVGENARRLEMMGIELRVPVLTLAQLSRAVEKRQDKRPMLSDLRESGNIEEYSDMVIMIYRDDYYNVNSKEPGIAEMIITKHRDGPAGTVKIVWQPQYARYVNAWKGGRQQDVSDGQGNGNGD